MSRQAGVSTENNFTKGLITEVTGVNSPENSVSETLNMLYDRKGRANRRHGIDYEAGALTRNLTNVSVFGGVIQEFLWETVANVGAQPFVVIQVADSLCFYNANAFVLSQGALPQVINMQGLLVPGYGYTAFNIINTPVTFSSGNGKLFVTHPYLEPFYVTFDSVIGIFTATLISVQTRDFEGVDDGLEPGIRPYTMSANHLYNLWNQGWSTVVHTYGTGSGNAIFAWTNNGAMNPFSVSRPDFPGNQDIWWYYKGTAQFSKDSVPFGDVFLTTQVDAVAVGNTPAPKGHYIYSAWDTKRSNARSDPGLGGSGYLPALVNETSSKGARPSVCSFYYGRVFYSGVRADKFASNIYFSQIIERESQYGKCYQQGDPTSENNFDLLSSDGGVIKIPDIVNIVEMRVFGPSLYVFATNGVWSITGSNNSAFKATDYQVTKVSSYPALSKTSIVDVGGVPVWWNNDGIYTLGKNDVSQEDSVQNLTLTTIQSFYDSIPALSKSYAKGAYNQLDGIVYWLFKSVVPLNAVQGHQFDSILVFDTVSKAFYNWSIPGLGDIFMAGLLPISVPGDKKIFKILTVGTLKGVGNSLTFSEFRVVDNLTDWQSESTVFPLATGVSYKSSFTTGYRIRGQLLKKFQTNYLSVVTETKPGSSCFVQGIWGYTKDPNEGKTTNPQQIYKTFFNSATYQRCKVKIRGNGYSLQFKFTSDGAAPFTIIGWSGFETIDAIP